MKKRRLLFVSANRFTNPYPVYPLGVSYLYSYLRERLVDFEIGIFDFNLHAAEDFPEFLREYKPDYTGVSMRNIDDVNSLNKEWFIHGYKEIVETIKKTVVTRLIIGGSAFSIYPKDLFDFFDPEFGIWGEGEESLHQLILALENGNDYRSIEGLVYRDNGKVAVNSRKNYLKSLDLSFDPALTGFYWDKSGMMNLQTKRGCPYNCIYCTYPLIEGTKVRTLDPEKIVATLSDLYFQKGIDYVFFTDSVFNIRNDFNRELAERIIATGIKIRWGAYFSPHNLSYESLALYKRAGLTHIEFGTESLSDSTLKHYQKHFSVDEVVEISNICNQLEIYFAHFMILGGYGETEASMDEGFENSKRIENTVFFPYIGMRIYPGTKLYELSLAEGVIEADDDLLEPVYYIAKDIDYTTLRERAEKSGRRWVFPDEEVAAIMQRMRQRKRKGSLWHHLKQ